MGRGDAAPCRGAGCFVRLGSRGAVNRSDSHGVAAGGNFAGHECSRVAAFPSRVIRSLPLWQRSGFRPVL